MTTTIDTPTPPEAPRQKRDRTHWLYIAVIAAVVVGVVVAAVLANAMLGQDVVWWPLGGPPDIG